MTTDLIPVIADEDREPELGHDSPQFPDLMPGWDDASDEDYAYEVAS